MASSAAVLRGSWRVGIFFALAVGASPFVVAGCSSENTAAPPPIDPPIEAMDAGAAQVEAAAPVEERPKGPIEERLAALPHVVTVREDKGSPDGGGRPVPAGYRRFEIEFEQATDHASPAGEKFKQRLSLLHKDDDQPMVLATSGYELTTGRSELTTAFGTNQIQVEHRYFPPSIPASKNYAHLTIRQSADDSHEIVQSFKTIYRGKWINTGHSKGGETAVYHRRFHPSDVDGTVAYVAPIVFSQADARFPPFFRNVGGSELAACRAKILAFQRAALSRRAEVVAAVQKEVTAEVVDQRLEAAIVDFPFGFFQYLDPLDEETGCAIVPTPTDPASYFVQYLEWASDYKLGERSDGSEDLGAYTVQTELELGNYAHDLMPVSDLLRYPTMFEPQAYLPPELNLRYRPESMREIDTWVKRSGDRILFIYGEWDPWTAARYEIGTAKEALLVTAPKSNHNAGVEDLTPADRDTAIRMIESWTDAKKLHTQSHNLEPRRFIDETKDQRRRR